MPSSPKWSSSLCENNELLAASPRPLRTLWMWEPVIATQVVKGTPFLPSPADPTSQTPLRPRATHCSLVHPSVLSAVLISMFSRMISEVGCSTAWSEMITSPCLLLFVPHRLCTLTASNTHLLVERMDRVENT